MKSAVRVDGGVVECGWWLGGGVGRWFVRVLRGCLFIDTCIFECRGCCCRGHGYEIEVSTGILYLR